MPYFASLGYDCYAPSYRGQGASDPPPDDFDLLPTNHLKDIEKLFTPDTVVVAHSFGGAVAQRWE